MCYHIRSALRLVRIAWQYHRLESFARSLGGA